MKGGADVTIKVTAAPNNPLSRLIGTWLIVVVGSLKRRNRGIEWDDLRLLG